MSAILRVFISSTMIDLANERNAVVKEISKLKFVPVNAENWMPNGMNSWQKINSEIEESDIFILLLGESYGWIPQVGFGVGHSHSATHLEFLRATELGLPILPFFKKLTYNTSRRTKDAQKRDQFRNKVAEWSTGKFRGEFELASDLSEMVSTSLLNFLAEAFKKEQNKRIA